jgi:hypothetical protein
MEDVLPKFLTFFPLFFAALWIGIGTLLGYMSGWFKLMDRYPDRAHEKPSLRLRMQWGVMGWGVRLRGVLNLSVCDTGLRVGMFRLFGIFSRPFLVPWHDITVSREKSWFGQLAKLEFGSPKVGNLTIHGDVADRLAKAAGDDWPE